MGVLVLFLLMFIGACAGSTGGGIKVSRLSIAFKSILQHMKRLIHPRYVGTVRFDNFDFKTTILAVPTCFNTVASGFGMVGPSGYYRVIGRLDE